MGRRPKSSVSPASPLVKPPPAASRPSTECYEDPKHSEQQILIIVGNNLRESRRHFGLTQTDVAERIGSAASYIGTIERGDANISLGMLCRLASVVGVSPQALLHETLLAADSSEAFHKLALVLRENLAVQRSLLASSVASFDTLEAAIKRILEATQEPSQAAGVKDKSAQRKHTLKKLNRR